MNSVKCPHCVEAPIDHPFKICQSAECFCPCIKQIYELKTNTRHDRPKDEHPHFLQISNSEVVELPNREHEIRNFSRVNKAEWIREKKTDKRTLEYKNKKKRKR